MPKKKFSSEHPVMRLRQVEVLLAQGKTIADACKEIGMTDKVQGRMFEWQNLLKFLGGTIGHRKPAPRTIAPKPVPLDEGSNMQSIISRRVCY